MRHATRDLVSGVQRGAGMTHRKVAIAVPKGMALIRFSWTDLQPNQDHWLIQVPVASRSHNCSK